MADKPSRAGRKLPLAGRSAESKAISRKTKAPGVGVVSCPKVTNTYLSFLFTCLSSLPCISTGGLTMASVMLQFPCGLNGIGYPAGREEQIGKGFGYKELNLLVNINRHCGQSKKTYA
jgi:hypothetical protein